MIEVAPITVRAPSTSTGKRFIGHSRAGSCALAGASPDGVRLPCSASRAFWQYEKECA